MKKVLFGIGCISFLLALWCTFVPTLTTGTAVLAAGFALCSGLTFVASAICAQVAGDRDSYAAADQRMQTNPAPPIR